MISPSFLQLGDTVAIVAPAKAVPSQKVREANHIIQSWGLQTLEGKHLFDNHHLFAGTDEDRLSDLQSALDNPQIKAIFCARGGYGTVRIVDRLNWSKFVMHPKWIIGFSDITYLHGKLHQLGFQSIHGPMPILFKEIDAIQPLEILKKQLFGELPSYNWLANPLNIKGKAEGSLIGGNLTILQQMIACEGDFDTENSILFIEEIGEYLYHFERMLFHLKRSGKLSRIKGLLIGQLTDMKDNDTPFGMSAEEIILNIAKEYNTPIAFGLPFGHEPENYPLTIGAKVILEVEENGVRLEYKSSQQSS